MSINSAVQLNLLLLNLKVLIRLNLIVYKKDKFIKHYYYYKLIDKQLDGSVWHYFKLRLFYILSKINFNKLKFLNKNWNNVAKLLIDFVRLQKVNLTLKSNAFNLLLFKSVFNLLYWTNYVFLIAKVYIYENCGKCTFISTMCKNHNN